MLIPVLYRLLIRNNIKSEKSNLSNKLLYLYELGLKKMMSIKLISLLLLLTMIPIGVYIYSQIDKQKLPTITQHDIVCHIDWNENIDVYANKERLQSIVNIMQNKPLLTSAYLGKNEFLLSKEPQYSTDAAFVYFDYQRPIDVENITNNIQELLYSMYPEAKVECFNSENIFQNIFSSQSNKVLVKFRNISSQSIQNSKIQEINNKLSNLNFIENNNYSLKDVYEIYPMHKRILLYNVDYSQLLEKLKIIFGGSLIEKVSDGSQSINIFIKKNTNRVFDIIQHEYIINSKGISIPLTSLLKYKKVNALQVISADNQGEYYSVLLSNSLSNTNQIQNQINNAIVGISDVETSLFNDAYKQEILFSSLIKVLIISILLLYLILAAQFESLVLPIIILFELVFDIAGALLFLYFFNSSLNLMSALGIIVMSGIIINDSILKIDTIHRNYKNGMLLHEAIKNGGHRRFLPIILTSLTTIFALLPLLFFEGLGIELQIPLALSIIGGLSIGTIISLFFIPLMYYYYGSIFVSKHTTIKNDILLKNL